MVEGILGRIFNDAGRFLRGELVLGLALELRLAQEHRQHSRRRSHHVVGGDLRGLLVADALAELAERLGERRAKAVLVRAAFAGGDRVAIRAAEAVFIGDPGDRPLDRAVLAFLFDVSGEHVLGHHRLPGDLGEQVVLEAAGEVEHGFGWCLVLDEGGIARPTDLDAAEEVGFGARHLEEPRRLERRALAEDFFIGAEADLGAAPVHDGAELLQLALRFAAREHHAIELLAARDLDFARLGERVDDGHADAVQAARRIVGLAVELAARVQRAHDDFERALVLELGMGIDGDAAAVVGDRQEPVGVEAHLDECGVSGDGLVHGIVDDLGEEVMQRLLVGAADVHAGPAAHGLQAFQHLDVGGGVIVGRVRGFLHARFVGHFRREPCEEVALRLGHRFTIAGSGSDPLRRRLTGSDPLQ